LITHHFDEDFMTQRIRSQSAAALLLAVLSTPALAHTGLGTIHGFAAGFLHPWLGVDHLLAMFAVGLWAAALGGRALWLLPLGFLSFMGLGAWLHFAGLALPCAEWLVSGSVLALGLALWRDWRTASGRAGMLVGLFALFHGHVHAAELGTDTGASVYAAGFLLATALLHGLGIAAGRGLESARRGFGLVCAGVGAYLLASL
jgi:urease accessory protein